MSDAPLVSILVPCRNEAAYIARCLSSVLAGDWPHERLEVLVVDGRSDDGTRDIVEAIGREHPGVVRLLDNPRRTTPAALNIAVRAARGDVVMRVDGHVTCPPDYVSRLVAALDEHGGEIVGGRIETLPGGDGAVPRAIAAGLAHPFGVGNSYFRIGSTRPRPVDHLPFFCCRRELFDRVGPFDEELARNQDGEFSARVIVSGGRILLVPHVVTQYYARDSLAKLARMFFQYGYFKVLSARKLGRILSVRQLVPATFLLAVAAAAGMALLSPLGAVALAAILGSYATAVGACAALALRRHPTSVCVALLVVFPVQHVCYGFGYLRRAAELAIAWRPAASAHVVPLSR